MAHTSTCCNIYSGDKSPVPRQCAEKIISFCLILMNNDKKRRGLSDGSRLPPFTLKGWLIGPTHIVCTCKHFGNREKEIYDTPNQAGGVTKGTLIRTRVR